MTEKQDNFFLDEQSKEDSKGSDQKDKNLLKPRKKSYWWAWVIAIIVLLVGYGGYAYFTQEKENPYITEVAAQQDILQSVDVTGTIKPAEEIDLNFKNAGTISIINVIVSDKVNKGDILATLDTTELNGQLSQAQANVAVAQAQYNQVLEGTRQEEIDVAKTNIKTAETSLSSAKINYNLTKNNIDNDLKTAQTNLTNTENLLDDAQKNLENIENQTDQNITNAIEDNLNAINLALVKEDSVRNNIDEIWETKLYYDRFKSLDFFTVNDTDNLLIKAVNQKSIAQNSYNIAKVSKTISDTQKAANDTLTYVNTYTQILYNFNSLLYLPNSDVIFTSTEITNLRSRQTSNEAAHNQNLSSVQSLTNAIANTELNNQIAIDNARTQVTNYQNQILTAIENIEKIQINSVSQLQASQDQIDNAENQLEIQKKQLQLQESGPTPAAIAVAQAQIMSAQAQANTIQTQISNLSIIAPVDGIITQVNVSIGEQSSSANPIIQMHSDAEYEINADIAETDINKIKLNDKTIITFDAFTRDLEFTGTVVEIEPSATIIQGVVYYHTKVILDDQDSSIKPGMTANIEIITAEKDNVVAAPNQSIKTESGTKFVEILPNLNDWNNVKTINIETGIRGNTHTEILSGLNGGENIIILKNE